MKKRQTLSSNEEKKVKDTLKLVREIHKYQSPTILLYRYLMGEELSHNELHILIFVLYIESLSNAGFAELAWKKIMTGKATITAGEKLELGDRMVKALKYHENLCESEGNKRNVKKSRT